MVSVLAGVAVVHVDGCVTEEQSMPQSVYKVIELIGTRTILGRSHQNPVAAETLRELRVAEAVEQDLVITDGKVEAYRTKLNVSFKYEGHQ